MTTKTDSSKFTDDQLKEWDEEKLREESWDCIVDSHHGQYIPQIFAKQFRGWTGWNRGDNLRLMRDGSNEKEDYNDIWSDCLNNLYYMDGNSDKWTLYHSCDLFAINMTLIEKWQKVNKTELSDFFYD